MANRDTHIFPDAVDAIIHERAYGEFAECAALQVEDGEFEGMAEFLAALGLDGATPRRITDFAS